MKKQTGFKPMPASLKVIFILNAIGLGFSAFGLIGITALFEIPTPFFGFELIGIPALILYIALVAAKILLLIVLLKRLSWAWAFGLGYFGFLILNGLTNTLNLKQQIITQPGYAELPEFAQNFGFVVGFITIFLIIGMYVTFLTFMVLRRGYFAGKKK